MAGPGMEIPDTLEDLEAAAQVRAGPLPLTTHYSLRLLVPKQPSRISKALSEGLSGCPLSQRPGTRSHKVSSGSVALGTAPPWAFPKGSF